MMATKSAFHDNVNRGKAGAVHPVPLRIRVDWNDCPCHINMWNQHSWGMTTSQSSSHPLLHPHLPPNKDK
eukprot:8245277-Ditylum_brightwellii.AAC.1